MDVESCDSRSVTHSYVPEKKRGWNQKNKGDKVSNLGEYGNRDKSREGKTNRNDPISNSELLNHLEKGRREEEMGKKEGQKFAYMGMGGSASDETGPYLNCFLEI